MPSNAPGQWNNSGIKGTGALGALAAQIAGLARQLNNFKFIGGQSRVYADRIEIQAPPSFFGNMPFWYMQENADNDTDYKGSKITIRPGNLRIHGDVNIAVAESVLTLSGDPEWLFVEHQRESDTATIAQATTEPETTATHLRVPLFKFVFDTDLGKVGRYRLDAQGIKNVGDINLDLPLR